MGERGTEALWGTGRRTATKLADRGLTTVGQLAAADPGVLADWFGPTTGPWLRQLALGTGSTQVSSAPRVALLERFELTRPVRLLGVRVEFTA